MGCSDSRVENPDEQAISLAEEALGFSQHSVKAISEAFARFAPDELISPSQFQELAKRLNLLTEDFAANSKITVFYDSWRDEHGNIPRTELQGLATLLGQGNKRVKACHLFRCFSQQNPPPLSQEHVKVMTDLLIKVSIRTSILVVNNQSEISNEASVMRYVQQMNRGKSSVVNLMNLVRADVLSEATFVDFVMLDHQSLTTTTGWRALTLAERNELSQPV